MACLFCLITFIAGLFRKDVAFLAVSALFAIADAISDLAVSKEEDQ